MIMQHTDLVGLHQFRWLWVTLKVTFAVQNFFVSNNSRNTMCIIYDMFTHELESAHGS